MMRAVHDYGFHALNALTLAALHAGKADEAHRIVLDEWFQPFCDDLEVLRNETLRRKVFMVAYWGHYDPQTPPHADATAGNTSRPLYCGLEPHQILTAFPDPYNTFVGVHLPQVAAHPERRPAAGLLLVKNPRSLAPDYGNETLDEGRLPLCAPATNGEMCSDNPLLFGSPQYVGKPVIQDHLASIPDALSAIVEANITLYSTFAPDAFAYLQRLGVLPRGVINKGTLSSAEYSDLFGDVSFSLGVGYPLTSPAPLESMAHGVAFLNPKFPRPLKPEVIAQPVAGLFTTNTQHDPLTLLTGAPYIYGVNFQEPRTVVSAAHKAIHNPFDSHTPDELSEEAITERVCTILSWDALPGNEGYDSREWSNSGPLSLEHAMDVEAWHHDHRR